VLKILSGRLSDRWSARKPFVIVGYSISTLVRPMVALATSWLHVLAVRLTDRVGKGIRSAPRDALLASWADPATRGYVFGLHRAMDHAGAIAGPLLASLFLWFFPEQFRTLFALTFIPGLIAVAMLVPVPDAPAPREAAAREAEAGSAPMGRPFSRYLAVLFLFSLGNSTDAFLLLRLSEVGVGAAWIPVAWAALHVVKAVVSPIGGHLSDRLSRRSIIAVGWLVYAAVYGGFALASRAAALIPLFLAYGVYYGLTEGVEKAVVADLAPAGRHGAAFGAYHAIIGIGALAASLVFAGVWKASGAPAAFALGGALALVSSVLLFALDLSPIMNGSDEENPRHE
jgi:MFS family permease